MLSVSPKIKTPNNNPNRIREYRNGVIADTSPMHIAEIIELYPTAPKTDPSNNSQTVFRSGYMSFR